jgi:hypothetical protein
MESGDSRPSEMKARRREGGRTGGERFTRGFSYGGLKKPYCRTDTIAKVNLL